MLNMIFSLDKKLIKDTTVLDSKSLNFMISSRILSDHSCRIYLGSSNLSNELFRYFENIDILKRWSTSALSISIVQLLRF